MIKEISREEWKDSQTFELNWWKATRERVGSPLIGCPRFSQDWNDELINDANGKIVVDVGSGPLGGIIREMNCKIGIAVDPLNNKYEKMGWIVEEKSFIPMVAPGESLPLIDEYADIVCTMNALDHMMNVDQAIKEMARVLKPSGKLYIQVDLREKHLICKGHKICLVAEYFQVKAKDVGLSLIKEQVESWKAKGVMPTYVGIYQKEEKKIENTNDDIARTTDK